MASTSYIISHMSCSVCVWVELRKQDHTHICTCTGNNITGLAVQLLCILYTILSGVATFCDVLRHRVTLQLDNY